MFLDADTLKINNVNMSPYLESVEYGYNKVWGKDSGRNLKGKMSGSLLGIVVKLKLNFNPTTQDELEILAPILDSAYQSTRYYDPKEKDYITIETYTGDWATRNSNMFSNVARANEKFSISVIATTPR